MSIQYSFPTVSECYDFLCLQNYRRFSDTFLPSSSDVSPTWGHAVFEYFLSEGLNGGRVGNVAKPFRPVMLNVSDLNSSFATMLLDYRVALAAQCILAATNRPLVARYSLPGDLADRPYWDCTSIPTFWASETSRVDNVSAGARISTGR